MAAHVGTFPFLPASPIQRTATLSKPASNLQHANEKIGQMIFNFLFTPYGYASIALVLDICNFDIH